MDDKRFDLVTKSLSSGISRRSLLRSLAAGLGVAAIGVERAAAAPGGGNGNKKCYGAGSLCTNAKQCCSGMCLNRTCAPEAECTPGASQACYSGPAGTAGVGICKAGTRTCDITGHWGSCAGEVLPATEICGNALDDDCDGQIDNGCGTHCQVYTDCPGQDTECQKRTCNAGICGISYTRAGTPLVNQTVGDCKLDICDGAGNATTVIYDLDTPDDGQECTKNVCSGGNPEFPPVDRGTWCGPGGAYVCDGKGACLPPNVCNPFDQQPCYSGDYALIGIGVCTAGIQTCDPMGMGWGPCEGEVLPSKELCGNGLDDDCDGVIDNGCSGGMPCQFDYECGMNVDCATYICDGGICVSSYAPLGTLLANQTPGDCRLAICDGFGNETWQPDDLDIPYYRKPCVIDVCKGGGYDYKYDPAGTSCIDIYGQDGQCDGAGACVPI